MSEFLRGSSGPVKADHDLNVPGGCRPNGVAAANSPKCQGSITSLSRADSPKEHAIPSSDRHRSNSTSPFRQRRRRSASARKCRRGNQWLFMRGSPFVLLITLFSHDWQRKV